MFLVFKGKYNNLITIPYKVQVGDIFEVNATVINTLPFNVTIISGNCNSDFSTNFYNDVEEITFPQCMNIDLLTVLEPGDKVTIQESSGTGKQYKAVTEGEVNQSKRITFNLAALRCSSSLVCITLWNSEQACMYSSSPIK